MSLYPIAMVSCDEFEAGRAVIPEFVEHPTYEDWLDCREGLFMGLSMSGVDSRLVDVSLKDFLAWCETEGLAPSEPALDSFASLMIAAPEREAALVAAY
jgi:hypothetical protein